MRKRQFLLIVGCLFAVLLGATCFGSTYAFANNDDGAASASDKADGWYISETDGRWHYSKQGQDLSGWLYYKNGWYYLDPADGAMATGFVSVDSCRYHLSTSGSMDTGWVYDDGNWYFASKSGALDKGWDFISGNWYYFNNADCSMLTGIAQIDSTTYHFGNYGLSKGWSFDDDSWYWCKDGIAQTGWLLNGSTWYYLDPAASGAMVSGKQRIDSVDYCFAPSGAMSVGWAQADGSWYYASDSGALKSGWLRVNSTWYFLDKSSCAMKTGILQLDGSTYYLDSSGAMQVGWIYEKGWLFANTDGALVAGWLNQNGVWYYLSVDTYYMLTGEHKIDSYFYYFDLKGAMSSDRWVGCSDGLLRYAGSSGAIDRSYFIKNGVVYRADGVDVPVQASGFVTISGQTFYANASGALVRGWLFENARSHWYFFDDQGVMKTGWVFDSGYWYYLNPEGSMAVGWKFVTNAWYYLNSDGSMAKGWLHLGSKWYWLDSSGAMATGMRVIDGVRRIFWSDGSCDKVGWQNPAQYPQVSSWTVKLPDYCTGYFTYVTPSRISVDATREDCVNAFIQRAYEYIGTQYIEPWSTAPGGAVDCSGFVLQCLYATGMDLGVYNPYNHRWDPSQTYNSMNWFNSGLFMPISTSSIQRGDVLYYRGHIAIALGGGMMIDSWPGQGVNIHPISSRGSLIGAARPFV